MSTNLEFFRKQAKALLKAVLSGDGAAIGRIAQQTGRSEAFRLHDAQLTVAREQGFASWPRFRAYAVAAGAGPVTEFIDAAVSSRKQAIELLAKHPTLRKAGFYADLVLGNVREVERELKKTPGLATAKSGPQKVEPLLYVCFSRIDNRPGLAETARVLLTHGADPNTTHVENGFDLSCLYAATGLNNNPALGEVLLTAGANPNDGESLYHSTEHRDHACMQLLLRHGAKWEGGNVLKHMLDREDLTGLAILLDAGADPNERNPRDETSLHWAVWRKRSAETIARLLDAGADPQAKRLDGRTAYALAVQTGQTDVAAVMRSRGAATELSAIDQALGDSSPLLENVDPANYRLLPDLAAAHHTAAVRALLKAGVDINTRGEHGATALHWACWKGYADVVEILLQHGASLTIEDEQFHADPAGWLDHGRENCGEPGGDYAAVARLLAQVQKPIY